MKVENNLLKRETFLKALFNSGLDLHFLLWSVHASVDFWLGYAQQSDIKGHSGSDQYPRPAISSIKTYSASKQ